MILRCFLIGFLLVPFYLKSDVALTHPIYVSVAEVDYYSEEHKITVALKVFTDDLEDALVEKGSPKLYLDTKKEIEDTDKYVAEYLKGHFIISDQKTKKRFTFNYIGKEYEDDATWIYFVFENLPENLKEIQLKNLVLFTSFPSQKNLTHIRKDGRLIKSTLFNRIKNTARLPL